MKHILFLLFIVFSISIYAQNGIVFENDSLLSNALIKAQNDNKLVFLNCNSQWCGEPCVKIYNSVFKKKTVSDYYNFNFVNITVDMDTPYGLEIMNQYNIHSYPSLLYLNSKGEILQIHNGSVNENSIIEIGKKAFTEIQILDSIKKKIISGDRTGITVIQYLNKVPFASNRESLINDYFQSIKQEDWANIDSWELIKRYANKITNTQFQYFIKNRKLFESKYSESAVKNKIFLVFNLSLSETNFFSETLIKLKEIDSVLLIQSLNKFMGVEMCITKTTNQWIDFKVKAEYVFDNNFEISEEILYMVCFFIYQHYKDYNDKTALYICKKIGAGLILKNNNSPEFNDLYAHIIFDLGIFSESVKYEEIALSNASYSKSYSKEHYEKELDLFKKSNK